MVAWIIARLGGKCKARYRLVWSLSHIAAVDAGEAPIMSSWVANLDEVTLFSPLLPNPCWAFWRSELERQLRAGVCEAGDSFLDNDYSLNLLAGSQPSALLHFKIHADNVCK